MNILSLRRVYRSSVKTVVLCTTLLASMVPGLANAEYLGLLNGRTATLGSQSGLGVELGIVTGDLGVADYQNIGARVNYRAGREVVIYGDIGISEFGSADGTPFGLGVFFHLSNQRISRSMDIAAKISYHTVEYEVGNNEFDFNVWSFDALFSGARAMSRNGLNWYGNVGFHRLSFGSGGASSDNEIGVGFGLVLPSGPGEAYAGVDFIDELTFGLGFRYFVR